MNTFSCLSPEQLQQYATGGLRSVDSERVWQHLQECPACRETFSGISLPTQSTSRPAGRLDQTARIPAEVLQPARADVIPEWALIAKAASPGAADSSSAHQGPETGPRVQPGQRLGQYELLQLLGRGGMGTVLKARHIKLDRLVALKVLDASIVRNRDMLKRFEREMQAVARLDHRHIVRAFDADDIDDVHFMVMEFVDGMDLSALVRRHGPLPIADACEMIRQAAVGLQHVHENDLVHRDLKPGNLMLTVQGQVKILDLGLALLHVSPQDGTELTATGQLMGTIDYMSPEQAENTHAVDIRSDIYSLGATLFALLVGHGPFGGNQFRSQFRKIAALATQPAPPLQSFREDAPDELCAVVARMLAHDSEQRLQTPEEILDRLSPFCAAADLAGLFRDVSSSHALRINLDHAGYHELEDSSSLLRSDQQTIEQPRLSMSPTISLQQESGTDPEPRVLHGPLVAPAVRSEPPVSTEPPVSGQPSLSNPEPAVATSPPGLRKRVAATVLLTAALGLFAVWSSRPQRSQQPATAHPTGTDVRDPHRPAPVQVVSDPATSTPAQIVDWAIGRLTTHQPSDNPAGLAEVWDLLQPAADPTIRTRLIHQLAVADIDPQLLFEQAWHEDRPGVRAALLLALGEYPVADSPTGTSVTAFLSEIEDQSATISVSSQNMLPTLLQWFETDPDPGVHSAVEWLLRRWGYGHQLQELSVRLQQKPIPHQGGWYQSLHGHTMVVIPGPGTFVMGSPEDEFGRVVDNPLEDETQHEVTLPYTFAVATREVSRLQFYQARPDFWRRDPPTEPGLPHNNCLWNSAAWYCNRLSALEGLPVEQHCYDVIPGRAGSEFRIKSNAHELSGYRLLTDEEWELVCRAGTSTARYFGRDVQMMAAYAFGSDQAAGALQLTGLLKPNDLGLFDTLGNISEWTHAGHQGDSGTISRPLRGGSVWTPTEGMRAAARYHLDSHYTNERLGLRIARTIVRQPRTDPLQVLVGPAASSPATPAANQTPDGPPDEMDFALLTHADPISLGTWDRGRVQPRWFRISNPGPHMLQLGQPVTEGHFQVAAALPQSLAAGQSADFRVAVSDQGIGLLPGAISIPVSADGDAGVCRIDLIGYVHGAVCQVLESDGLDDTGQFSFGRVPLGGKVTHAFSILNYGDRNLRLTDVTVSAGFELVRQSGSDVGQHDFGHLTVSVDSSTVGHRTGVLEIRSSDEKYPLVRLPLSAEVVRSDRFSITGVFRQGIWLLDTDFDLLPDEEFYFGLEGDLPVTGDWNGDGICDVGICRPGERGQLVWKLCLRNADGSPGIAADLFDEFTLGPNDAIPISLDLNGDGTDEPACVIVNEDGTLSWLLKDEQQVALPLPLQFSQPADVPIAGDWDGDGIDDPGVVYPSSREIHRSWKLLRNDAEPAALVERHFGEATDIPVIGDWDADGIDEIGMFRTVNRGPAQWLLDISGDGGLSEREHIYGEPGDIPVVLSGFRPPQP